MSAEFELDISAFIKAMEKSAEAVNAGAKQGLTDIKDDWVRGAVDIAPVDSGNLRKQINGKVGGMGADGFVEIQANATSDTGGKRFNYAYYIHEGHMRADGKSLRTPGTEEEFLKKSMEKRQDDYQKWLEEEIQAELQKAGW